MWRTVSPHRRCTVATASLEKSQQEGVRDKLANVWALNWNDTLGWQFKGHLICQLCATSLTRSKPPFKASIDPESPRLLRSLSGLLLVPLIPLIPQQTLNGSLICCSVLWSSIKKSAGPKCQPCWAPVSLPTTSPLPIFAPWQTAERFSCIRVWERNHSFIWFARFHCIAIPHLREQ